MIQFHWDCIGSWDVKPQIQPRVHMPQVLESSTNKCSQNSPSLYWNSAKEIREKSAMGESGLQPPPWGLPLLLPLEIWLHLGTAKAAPRRLFCRWAWILPTCETRVPAEVSSVTWPRWGYAKGASTEKKVCIPRSCCRFRSGLTAKIWFTFGK